MIVARKDLLFGAACAFLVLANAGVYATIRAMTHAFGDYGLPPANRRAALIMAGLFILITWLTLLVVRAYGRRITAGNGPKFAIIAAASAAIFTFALLFPPIGSADNEWNVLMARAWVVHGQNPYITTPDMLTTDPLYPSVSTTWRGWSAVYGPLWTSLSALPVLASPDPAVERIGLRLLCTISYVAAGFFLHAALARRRGKDALPVLAFWLLNPAAAFEIANAGHNEGVLILFLSAFAAGSALVLPRLAAAGLTAAVLVKIWPAIFLPSLLGIRAKKREWAGITFACIAATVCAYAPFWAGRETFASLWHHASLAGNTYFYAPVRLAILAAASVSGLESALSIRVAHDVTLVILLGTCAAAGWLTWRRRISPVTAAIAVFVAYHGISLNWLQPWHLLAALPLIVASSAEGRLTTELMALAAALGFAFYGAPPWLVAIACVAAAISYERSYPMS